MNQFGARTSETAPSNAFCFNNTSAATKSTTGQFSIIRTLFRTYYFHSILMTIFLQHISDGAVRSLRLKSAGRNGMSQINNRKINMFEITYFYVFHSVSRMSPFWKALSGSDRLVQNSSAHSTFICSKVHR